MKRRQLPSFVPDFFIKFLLLATIAFGNFVSGMKIKPIRFHSLGKLRSSFLCQRKLDLRKEKKSMDKLDKIDARTS